MDNMREYLVSVVIVSDEAETTHRQEILAEGPADAWPQGLEIATATATALGGAIVNLSVTEIK